MSHENGVGLAHIEQNRAVNRASRKRNPGKSRYDSAKRHAAKLRALPMWVDKAHKRVIRTFYDNCPQNYEVDHIVPLRGKIANGLHVIWNLQYLPKEENRRKSNKI